MVDRVVHWVSVAIGFEGHLSEREEEGGGNALVNGVFGDVDKKKRDHAIWMLVFGFFYICNYP